MFPLRVCVCVCLCSRVNERHVAPKHTHTHCGIICFAFLIAFYRLSNTVPTTVVPSPIGLKSMMDVAHRLVNSYTKRENDRKKKIEIKKRVFRNTNRMLKKKIMWAMTKGKVCCRLCQRLFVVLLLLVYPVLEVGRCRMGSILLLSRFREIKKK